MPRSVKPSGEIGVEAAKVVKAAPGELYGVVATPNGTNVVVVTVYNSASAASGTVLASLRTTDKATGQLVFEPSVPASAGLTVVVTGTGAKVYVYYI